MPSSESSGRLAIGMTYTITVLCAGSSLPTSLYNRYALVYRLVPFDITALFAIYVAAIAPTMVLCGGVSDVLGRRRVLTWGLCLSAAGSIVFATAGTPGQLFAARVLQGIALGLSTGAGTAALADHLPERRAASLASIAISLGSASGPLLGGLVAQVTPSPLSYPFVVHVALLVPAYLCVRRLPDSGGIEHRLSAPVEQRQRRPRMPDSGGMRLPLSTPVQPRPWRPRLPSVPRPVRRDFAIVAGVTALAWSLLGFFLALAPAVVAAFTDSATTALAGGVVALMLAAAAVTQSRSHKLAGRSGLVTALSLMPAGTVILMVAVLGRDLAVLAVAAVVIGGGQGLGFSVALARITAVTPAERRGAVLTAVYLVGYFALAVPVLGIGVLAARTGLLPAVLWFGGPTTAGCLVMLLVALRRTPSSRVHPTVVSATRR